MSAFFMWVGIVLTMLFVTYVFWELFAWFMWPCWVILAQLRMLAHREGVGYILSWRIIIRTPIVFVHYLRDYWTFFGGYCEGTTTWDCAVWHKPLHPFSPGRMEFWDRPNAKADLAPASGAQVQRLVGRISESGEKP